MSHMDTAGAAAVDEHLRTLRAGPAAVQLRRGRLLSFAEWIHPKPLLEAIAADLEAWSTDQWRRGLKPATLDSYAANVRAFYRWADQHGLTGPAQAGLVEIVRRHTRARFEPDTDGLAAMREHLADMRRRGLRTASVQAREGIVRRFALFVAPATLLATTAEDLWRWQDDLIERDLGRWTVFQYTAGVRAFFDWATRRSLVATNPAAELVLPRRPQGVPRPIGEEDLRAAVRAAAGPLRVWLLLASLCGLRAGEIARLRREHILDDISPALLHVADGKGGRQRTVPLPAAVLAELEPVLQRPRGRLWLDGEDDPAKVVSTSVARHMTRLGLPFTAHNLRHRYASQLYQRSRDLRMVQDLLGHSSPATTAVYTQFDRELATVITSELADELAAALVTGGVR